MRNLLTSLVVLLALTVISSCQKEVSQEYGSPAKGSLQGNGGDCLPKLVGGSYISNKALTDSNFIDVTIDVTSAGPYTITTDTVNGYSFKASGTFANTGSNTVRMKGVGTPVNPGVNNFSVVFDSSYCEVNITVLPSGSTGGPAVFTLVGSPSGCSAFNLTGSYAKDGTLDASHSITLNINVTSPGTYNVSTTTVNGYTFSGSGILSVPGTAQIKLQGSGKPAAAGTDNFTVTAGSSSCTFPVTVTVATTPPANNDYFPIAANNWWSYDYTGGAPDTLTMKITGPRQIGGQTYQRFEWASAAAGPFLESFYRKDASNGFYYEGIDTAGFGAQGVLFTNTAALHVNFLRNTLTTGQTWNTDYPVTLSVPGLPSGSNTLRFKYTCNNANATLTTSTGRALTNVYEISFVLQANVGGQFVDISEPFKTYYAKGIGQVKYRDEADPSDIYEEIIRYWQVN